jgi:hypothetical protein
MAPYQYWLGVITLVHEQLHDKDCLQTFAYSISKREPLMRRNP